MPARELRAYAHATIHTAAIWDVLGVAGALPPWWPPVSYVLIGAGSAAACLSVLLVTLAPRRRTPAAPHSADPASERVAEPSAAGDATTPAAPSRTSRNQAGQLLATGILIVGWMLRGHAEIPPDIPIVAAQIAAAALFAFFTMRRR